MEQNRNFQVIEGLLMDRGAVVAAVVLGALVLAAPVQARGPTTRTHAPRGPSGIYCLRHGKAVDILAVRPAAGGGLDFGVSRWSANGRNVSVVGRAVRAGDHWRYEAGAESGDPAVRCRIDIRATGARGVTLSADPKARCESQGGQGTNLGVVSFPARTYWGPVTTQLKDPEAFSDFTGC